jgi:hypothetical protein
MDMYFNLWCDEICFVIFHIFYLPLVYLFVCFPGVTTHCGCIFHSPVVGFNLLVFEVS